MPDITIMSFAKINLSIDVGGAGEDGFHAVDMIMQQVAFHDDVKISFEEDSRKAAGEHGVTVKTNRHYLPTDERNIAFKAAVLMSQRYGGTVRGGDIKIDIFKRIPVAAGMAGGSGNAAAVVHGLNVLWDLRLSLNEIMDICAELGSDVPFCAIGQARADRSLPAYLREDPMASSCARATGRGTVLEPVKGLDSPIVFAKPRLGVSTKEVFKGIDSCEITRRPDNDELKADLEKGSWNIYNNFINVLEEYTLKKYSEVAELKSLMEKGSAEKVLMSGSGPTVFAVYRDMTGAKRDCEILREKGYEAYWTTTTG